MSEKLGLYVELLPCALLQRDCVKELSAVFKLNLQLIPAH